MLAEGGGGGWGIFLHAGVNPPLHTPQPSLVLLQLDQWLCCLHCCCPCPVQTGSVLVLCSVRTAGTGSVLVLFQPPWVDATHSLRRSVPSV